MLIDNATYTGQLPVHFAKRAAIMCDILFMDTQGLGPSEPQQDEWIYSVLAEPKDRAYLKTSKEFKDLLLRPQDLGGERDVFLALHDNQWGSENPDNLSTNAYEVARIMGEEGAFERAYKPYKAQGSLAMQLAHDLRMPIKCQQWFDSPVAILNPLHRALVGRLLSPSLTPDPLSGIAQLEYSGMADFAELSWEDVFELRKSRFWRNFRSRMDNIGSNEDYLSTAMWVDLWRYVGETFPKLGKASILGIVASLPFPGASIAGFASSAFDIADAMKTREEFGWLYFLFDVRRKLHHPPNCK
jgi:hypothetical protein